MQSNPDQQLDVVLRDYDAAYNAVNDGRLSDHAGQYVAFYNGTLVGWGTDPERLRDRIGRQLQVHPERLAVIHVKDQVVL